MLLLLDKNVVVVALYVVLGRFLGSLRVSALQGGLVLHQSITSESNHINSAASSVLNAQNDAITLFLSVERRVMNIAEHWTARNNH